MNSLEEWAKIATQETITNYKKFFIALNDAFNTEFNAFNAFLFTPKLHMLNGLVYERNNKPWY